MKINGNELRTGNIVEYQGRLMRAAKVHIVQMGNWRSFLQVELRDIRDGTKLNERVQLDEKQYQFLYKEGEQYTFMDNETYDQIAVEEDLIGEPAVFLQEGMQVSVQSYEEKPISVTIPGTVIMRIEE